MIFFILVVAFCYLIWSAFRYPDFPDDYLVYLIGKKRSGKTTFLAWSSIHYWLRGRPVYSTCPMPCAKLISADDIGAYHFPKYSVILCDEVGLLWNNRHFKNFKDYHTEYFKLQGHYKHLVIMCSQAADVDKKIRDLVDVIGVCVKLSARSSFSIIKWVNRKITLTEAEGDKPSSVTESLSWRFPLFGGWFFMYRPLFYPFFDSYEAPELPHKKFKVPSGLKHKFKRKQLTPVLAFWDYRIRLFKLPTLRRKRPAPDVSQVDVSLSPTLSDSIKPRIPLFSNDRRDPE